MIIESLDSNSQVENGNTSYLIVAGLIAGLVAGHLHHNAMLSRQEHSLLLLARVKKGDKLQYKQGHAMLAMSKRHYGESGTCRPTAAAVGTYITGYR